jgi:wyosine [tRNA(Phe)-imidazoG37] synthetase (radical SAM superfamily)
LGNKEKKPVHVMQTIPLQSKIIYGPVKSRRLRFSLGLNILPIKYKFCFFSCIYCHYGWTKVHAIDATDSLGDLPTCDSFAEALESVLREHKHKKLDNMTFSGNGEPTLHPNFEELVNIAKRLRDKYNPKAKVGVLSNSSTLSLEKVSRALSQLDFRIMKLDAGDAMTFKKVNRPCSGVDYGTILKGIKSLENITLQTMFIDGAISNIGECELIEWMKRVGEIKPTKVQIYSLRRPLMAAAASSLREVSAAKLTDIAMQTEKATGVSVDAIVAAIPYSKKIFEQR